MKLGFQYGPKALKAKIPEMVLNSNLDVKKALLRGLFDADGCFACDKSRAPTTKDLWKKKYHYSPEVHYGSCSKKLIEQVKKILDDLNIKYKYRLKTKKGRRRNRNVNNHYDIRIRRRDDMKKWLRFIGSNNPRHMTRISIWKNFGFLPPNTNIVQRKKILKKETDPYDLYE